MKTIIERLRNWLCDDCMTTNAMLRQEIDILAASEEVLEADVHELQERVKTLNGQLNDTLALWDHEQRESELEAYWNTKRKPTNSYQYRGRVLAGNRIPIDVRVFWTENNNLLPKYNTGSNDDKAMSALRWVANNITYTTDAKQFDSSEHWLFPFETLHSRKGDCEDGAIVMANIMLNSGIPYWRIRLNAGDVKGGGHAWVTYLRESDDQWVVLDWCYWPNDSLRGLLWSDAENYFNIWFSWNRDHVFANDMLDRKEE